jgi:hypothetical protein
MTTEEATQGEGAQAPAPVPEPTWNQPAKYGYAEAVNMAGSVAAPLLCGFTVTLLGIVITNGSDIRWPGLTTILLAAAAAVLLFSVQAAFTARAWQVSPSELKDWWPEKTGSTVF